MKVLQQAARDDIAKSHVGRGVTAPVPAPAPISAHVTPCDGGGSGNAANDAVDEVGGADEAATDFAAPVPLPVHAAEDDRAPAPADDAPTVGQIPPQRSKTGQCGAAPAVVSRGNVDPPAKGSAVVRPDDGGDVAKGRHQHTERVQESKHAHRIRATAAAQQKRTNYVQVRRLSTCLQRIRLRFLPLLSFEMNRCR